MTTCQRCNGTGKIASTELHRGRRVDIFVPCWRCRTTGLIEAEQERIDAEKAAHEATLPDYLIISQSNAAARHEPF